MKTKPIRNILVPVDFSELSVVAIDQAKRLAERFDAVIHLTHIHEFYYPSGLVAPTMPLLPFSIVDYEKDMEKKMREQLRALAVRQGLHAAAYHVGVGTPTYSDICLLAKEIPADLIVMPTHGYTGLKHILLGSTTERVVQHANCPVFVVRKSDSARNGIQRILVPVDFSACSLAGLHYAIKFAHQFGAEILVQHVIDFGPVYLPDNYGIYDLSKYRDLARKYAKDQMREFTRLADFGKVKFETAITVGSAAQEICLLAANRAVDLVLTSTHGRTGFKHVLIGSTAEKLVRQASCDVLVVPSHPDVRSANLESSGAELQKTANDLPKSSSTVETTKLTRRHRKQIANPFPERRRTNKFRESHLFHPCNN
ncbi:MAG TPA: universal stress protein [Chthoniobacterales bacterium]|nr:universal stress protein [Chthoniobacterales bacterium]